MPCTQWAISATEILSLATVLHQWQSQGQIKTSVLVPWVEHHWRTPCVSYEVSSRTEPQFPIVTSCSQIIYIFSGLSPCLFSSVLCSFYCISYNHFSDKQLAQILNSESISRKIQSDTYYQRFFFLLLLLHSFEIYIIIMTTQYSIKGYMIFFFTNTPLLFIRLFPHLNIKSIARMNKWISLCKKV